MSAFCVKYKIIVDIAHGPFSEVMPLERRYIFIIS